MTGTRLALAACAAALALSWAQAAPKAVLVPGADRKEAVAAFNKLIDLYEKNDRDGFMARVSEKFEGSRDALENGLQGDFEKFSSIDIQPVVRRVGKADESLAIEFTFTRRVQVRATGKVLTDRSKSRLFFAREGKAWKLRSMSEPVIFGVSAASEAATSAEPQSRGNDVLSVNDDGDAKLAPPRRK